MYLLINNLGIESIKTNKHISNYSNVSYSNDSNTGVIHSLKNLTSIVAHKL